jgi:predicted O-methyltransferase YrrM
MFHTISPAIQAQMVRLEQIDAQDRLDGTPRAQRLRQIPAETGQFLAILAANSPPGHLIEIGTSAGYSTLWLSLASRLCGRKITTFEVLEEKARLAAGTFKAAQVEEVVELVTGDARDYLPRYQEISFCFLDAEKELYGECYEMVVPNLTSGGLLVADNAINHQEILQPVIDLALADEQVDALVVPIGKGLLLCRKH